MLATLLVVDLIVLLVTGAEVVDDVLEVEDETEDEDPTAPDPIDVVMGALSIYTPEKYQCSMSSPFSIRSTPTWKSALFVEVDAAMF